jgi:class 3 adenylate cyclase
LVNKEAKIIGVIRSARSDRSCPFTEADKELLESYGRQITYFIDRMKEFAIPLAELTMNRIGPYLPIRDLDDLLESFGTLHYKTVTIMFIDIRGFTEFSDTHFNKPTQISDLLSIFFETVGPLVAQNGGTIDKFQGDGFIALFNAYTECKEHELQAVRCARDMEAAFRGRFSKRLINLLDEKHGLVLPVGAMTLGLKIGIGNGRVMVGPLGFGEGVNERREFTVIGDEVNKVSRLVSDVAKVIENKSRPGPTRPTMILLTHDTFKVVESHVEVEKHEVEIRGVSGWRRIYEITGWKRGLKAPDTGRHRQHR